MDPSGNKLQSHPCKTYPQPQQHGSRANPSIIFNNAIRCRMTNIFHKLGRREHTAVSVHIQNKIIQKNLIQPWFHTSFNFIPAILNFDSICLTGSCASCSCPSCDHPSSRPSEIFLDFNSDSDVSRGVLLSVYRYGIPNSYPKKKRCREKKN